MKGLEFFEFSVSALAGQDDVMIVEVVLRVAAIFRLLGPRLKPASPRAA